MRILVVSSFLPYPLFSGGHVRLYNLLKELSKRHRITLVCEKRDFQTHPDIKAVEAFCEQVITIPRRKQWSLQNIVKTGFSNFPFLLVGHTLPEMKRRIVQALNEKQFDVIHVETFYVNQNLPKTYLPVVLVEHNVEYEVYSRYAATAPGFMKPFLQLDIAKLKSWETYFWKKATKLVAVSEKERTVMNREDVVVVPNGVDLSSFPFRQKNQKAKQRRALFIGDFKWIQNKETARMILEEIWPAVKSKENLKLWIVGKHIPDSIKSFGGADVIFDENAPDETKKIYQKADMLLAPIIVGGGTSYKILEAMASGVPVITTKLGAEGLGAAHRKQVLIAEKAIDLAKLVDNLISDQNLYSKIAKEARGLIEQKYSWEKIAQTLESVYKAASS